MATVAMNDVVLYDRWPGYPNFNLSKPTNGFDSTVAGSGNCVSTPLYPPGTKIAVNYSAADQSEWPGQSVFCYLRFHEGSDNAYDIGDVSTGYCACFKGDSTNSADGSAFAPTTVTSDLTNSDATYGGAIAFACCDLSGNYTAGGEEWGWFWVGGVCPVTDVTRLAGDIKTVGTVTAQRDVFVEDDGTNCASLELADITLISDTTSLNDLDGFKHAVGYSIVADA